jgi:hypothetical protein
VSESGDSIVIEHNDIELDLHSDTDVCDSEHRQSGVHHAQLVCARPAERIARGHRGGAYPCASAAGGCLAAVLCVAAEVNATTITMI